MTQHEEMNSVRHEFWVLTHCWRVCWSMFGSGRLNRTSPQKVGRYNIDATWRCCRLRTVSSLFRSFTLRLMLFFLTSSSADVLFAHRGVAALCQFVCISFLLLWVQACVYPTWLSLLLCDQKKKKKREKGFCSVLEGKCLEMCERCEWGRGEEPEGIWINTRFMSLWDFALILKGRRHP